MTATSSLSGGLRTRCCSTISARGRKKAKRQGACCLLWNAWNVRVMRCDLFTYNLFRFNDYISTSPSPMRVNSGVVLPNSGALPVPAHSTTFSPSSLLPPPRRNRTATTRPQSDCQATRHRHRHFPLLPHPPAAAAAAAALPSPRTPRPSPRVRTSACSSSPPER